MRFHLLGPVAVHAGDGTPVALPGARARAILAMLLISRPDAVSATRLFETGHTAKDPVNALHVQIAKLRAALPEPRLLSEPGGYRIVTHPGEVDADAFAEACARGRTLARTGEPEAAVPVLRQALDRWRAPVEFDFADAWRAEMEELRLTAIETAADAEIALGRSADVLAELTGLVARHPLRERPAALLMRALAAQGRRPEALVVFGGLRERLADELGADPSPEIAALHLDLLRTDDRLHAQPRSAQPQALTRNPASHPIQPPAPAANPTPGNVPHPIGHLSGRDTALADLHDLLHSHRLVSITGPGGAGKTRAARELGHRLRDTYRDGAWMVELASVARDGAVLDAVSATVLPGEGVGRDRLLSWLRDREVLLVLDNCEHLVDDAAAAVSTLLGLCPRLTVLTTSREPLNVEGERPYPLAPLELADAMRLFRDRAPAARGDDAELARLCGRLDGLPLAIEIAAAGTRLFSLGEIGSRLDELANAARHAPARHHSLRSVLDWSHDLLTPAERRVFAGLSVFQDGCVFADAERVCGADAVVLARLVDKSLVVTGRDGRFRLLETVRVYAAATTDTQEFRDRHADVLLAFAREVYDGLSAPGQDALLTRFLAELPNLRAVTTWLLDTGDGPRAIALQGLLGYFWYVSGREAEGAAWLGRAIDCFDADPRPGCDGALAVALAWHSYLAWMSGALPDPWLPAERVLGLFETTEAKDDVRIALVAITVVAVHLRPELAQQCLDDTEKALAGLHHPWIEAILDAARSDLHRRAGDLEEAVAAATANLRYFESIEDRFGVLYSQLRLGDAEEHAGREDLARTRWAHARDAALDCRSPVKRGYAELRLAYLDLDPAAIEAVRHDAVKLAAHDLAAAATALLGVAHAANGDVDTAVDLFRQTVSTTRALPIRTAVAAAHLVALDGPQWADELARAVERITDPLHLAALRALLAELPGLDGLRPALPAQPVCTPLAALV
ncbi:AfsR/SARP family transcriptional regulator [Lentzea sp. CA-135723]|uniref:AfsR/SARP family transcriptional regulator n=1 Tax=Lentzea sp. CA-135723 TaxID=3239950 RepID=UPI003D8FB2FE